MNVLNEGDTYEMHYWIDSNDGGGTMGACDSPLNDHQWKGVSFVARSDADITVNDDDTTADVCSTFGL